jgi:hypothetical protein
VREFVEQLQIGGELERFLAVDGEHDRRAAVAVWRPVARRSRPLAVNHEPRPGGGDIACWIRGRYAARMSRVSRSTWKRRGPLAAAAADVAA